MKRIVIILISVLVLTSCSKEEMIPQGDILPPQDEVNVKEPVGVDIIDIKDATKSGEIDCATAEEIFYNDGEYFYSFGCIKSKHITVCYSDGTSENIVAALESGRVTIDDLDKFKISYFKEKNPFSSTTVTYKSMFDEKESWVATFGGKDSYDITELLLSLDYSEEMCKCLPEYSVKTTIGDYGLHLSESESYARLGTKQATLTEEQREKFEGILELYSKYWGMPKE